MCKESPYFDFNNAEKIALRNGLIPNPKGSILFTSHGVFASQYHDIDDSFVQENTFRFDVQGLHGDHYIAFPVIGNSMYPEIKQHEIVIVKRLETIWQNDGRNLQLMEDISPRQVYVIRNKIGNAWVKRIEPIKNKKGTISELKLISVNPKDTPFKIKFNSDIELYKVVRLIKDMDEG